MPNASNSTKTTRKDAPRDERAKSTADTPHRAYGPRDERATESNRPTGLTETLIMQRLLVTSKARNILIDALRAVEEQLGELMEEAYYENHPASHIAWANDFPAQTGRVYRTLKARGIDTSLARLRPALKRRELPQHLRELPDLTALLPIASNPDWDNGLREE